MKTKFLLSSLFLAGMLMMGTTRMQAQCHAGFTFNASAGTVAFTNTSTGGIGNTNYQWNFGDGNYAYGSTSVTHAYYNGTYVACLYMSDSSNTGVGCSSSFCDTIVITNGTNPPCVKYWGYRQDSSNTNANSIQFYDQTTAASWSWDFGDGSTSTQMDPTHQYANAGAYFVCLTTVTANGSTCTTCDSIRVHAPCNLVAGFTFNSANDPTITFTNTSTGGSAPFYNWNFGDGNSSYSLNATHTYQYKGTYNVCLTVYDSLSNGCQASHCDTIIITNGMNPPCSAYFSYAIDSMQQQGAAFHDYSANSPISWSWNFGDGNTSTQQNPVHQYAQAGTYTVCLTIVNSFHDSCTYCTSVNYYPCNQVAGFTVNGSNDPQIIFTNTSTGGYAPYYYWNFGDGNSSYSLNATHTYQYNGTYNVCLTIYDSLSNRCQASQCSTVTITHALPQPCNAVFYSDSVNTTATSVGFYDASTGGATSWLWNFGDGATSTLQNPVHQYTQSGTYSVCLTITTPAGTCSYCRNVSVGSISCSANVYLVQDSSNTNPLFWYVYSRVTGTAPFTYLWNFGDGTTSTQAYPTHNYATPGHYNICLTITDATGCTSSSCDSTYKVSSSGIIGSLAVVNALAGIEENSVSVNSIFPNPANDLLEVSLSQPIKGEIKITDMTGREVYSQSVNTNNIKVNVSTLPAGYFNLSVVSGTKTIHSKLMIVR